MPRFSAVESVLPAAADPSQPYARLALAVILQALHDLSHPRHRHQARRAIMNGVIDIWLGYAVSDAALYDRAQKRLRELANSPYAESLGDLGTSSCTQG